MLDNIYNASKEAENIENISKQLTSYRYDDENFLGGIKGAFKEIGNSFTKAKNAISQDGKYVDNAKNMVNKVKENVQNNGFTNTVKNGFNNVKQKLGNAYNQGSQRQEYINKMANNAANRYDKKMGNMGNNVGNKNNFNNANKNVNNVNNVNQQ